MTGKKKMTFDEIINPETPPRLGPNEAEQLQEAIAKLNDEARRNMHDPLICTIVLTQGVAFLPSEEKAQILEAVRNYENWTRGNDTYSERDFGVVTKVNKVWTQEPQGENFKGETVYFKFDYYSKQDPNYGSRFPYDSVLTKRVLTIMKCEEW